MTKLISLAALPLFILSQQPYAETENVPVQEILVTGGKDALRELAGSATLVDEQAIQEFNISNLDSVMAQIPGVYIRQEDGYGLRPNIGIRGATSERSQKITLMEDGILIAPAPYSAPAAYYLPNVNRMSAVEVFKGPSAIRYGPHTVGGAMNLATRSTPTEQEALVDLTVGSSAYRKLRGFYGDSFTTENQSELSYWVDALHYGADGFKELDNGSNTGFERNDFNIKLQWQSPEKWDKKQWLQIKLGFANEDSLETYLGLTDEDFQANPLRRYLASANDHFVSEHSQVHILHNIEFDQSLSLFTKTYLQTFDREWSKFDGFFPDSFTGENPWLERVGAAQALGSSVYLPLIKGEIDSDGQLDQTLDITNNAREYGSNGIESTLNINTETGAWEHSIDVGVRFHHDYVDRNHHAQGYQVQSGALVYDGIDDRPKKLFNHAQSDALALYITDDIDWKNLQLNLGLRSENIKGELEDLETAEVYQQTNNVLLASTGLFYQWKPSIGFLLGVNQGFSPSSPGYSETSDSEESINYEYGLRFENGEFIFDAIGFFSDYSNLLGRCRISDSDCDPDTEFSGGEVQIGGLELTGRYQWYLGDYQVPLSWVYTYTESAFQTSFESGFSQWGNVTEGDELPYTPNHQGRIQLSIHAADMGASLAAKYTGQMRELPGYGSFDPEESTEAFTTIDLSLYFQYADNMTARLVIENIRDEQIIVSRKPFGARPNAPRFAKLSLTYTY